MKNALLLFCSLLFCLFSSLAATQNSPLKGPLKAPWGQDSKLIKERHICKNIYTEDAEHVEDAEDAQKSQRGSSLLQQMALSVIWFHKRVISPADGPRSHFRPNSSQYTIDAMERYGFLHGYLLGCDRLMRENPEAWIYRTMTVENGWITKWDPVR